MIEDLLKIYFNSLTKRKLRSWLTMIGIFIGIATVVALIGLGEGLRNAITSQFGNLGPDFITVQAGGISYGPPGTGAVTPLTKDLADKIKSVNGVDMVIPRLIKTGLIEFNDHIETGYVVSMLDSPEREEIERLVSLKAEYGRLLKDGDGAKVVLGNNFGKSDNAYGKAIQVGNNIIIQGKKYQVVGIMKKAGSFVVDGALLLNDKEMRDLFDEPDEVSIIAVKVKDVDNVEAVKAGIEKLLRKERNVKKGEEDFSVELALNTLDTINSTLFAVNLFVYIIAGISILVGGIGIMNTMYTAVVERTKEIGIMKSIGAKRHDIFILFLIESGLLGLVGGTVGIIIGFLMAKGLAFAGALALGSDLIQAKISIWLVIGSLLFSFVIGCVSGLTPALQASKLHPVEALRYAK